MDFFSNTLPLKNRIMLVIAAAKQDIDSEANFSNWSTLT